MRKSLFIVGIFMTIYTNILADTQWSSPSPYENDMNEEVVLSVPDANNITVTITGETERYYDRVYIWNGDKSIQLKTLHGDIDEIFNVDGDSIYVNFTSDYSLTKSGVTITITEPNTKAEFNSLHVKEDATIGGDLYVKGEIILSENDNTCSGDNEGAMRYNQTAKNMEFCDGTSWFMFAKNHANTSCKTILDSGQSIGDGIYEIDPDGAGGVEPFDVYCDMTTDGGGYTFYTVTNGIDTYRSTDTNNTCQSLGMDILIPRTRDHFQSIINYGIPAGNPHVIFGITKPTDGCGGCTSNAMNSGVPEQSNWKALDGGDWWLRSTPYGEPNGDYTANCWLGFLTYDSADDIRFNDSSCNYHSKDYLCSTNDK